MVACLRLETRAFRGLSAQPCRDNGVSVPRGLYLWASSPHLPLHLLPPSADVTIQPLVHPHTFRASPIRPPIARPCHNQYLFPFYSTPNACYPPSAAHFQNTVDRKEQRGREREPRESVFSSHHGWKSTEEKVGQRSGASSERRSLLRRRH